MSRKVQQGKDRLLLVVMLIHLAVVLFWGISTEHIHTFWWGLGATIAAFAAFSFRPGTLFSRSVIAIGLVIFSAVLIHQSNGLIEWHFHIFAVLVLLAIYYDWRVIVIAAIAVAVHHLIGLLTTLYSVYAPNPDLGIYSLHILFVALCAGVLCYQCEVSVRHYKLINERNTQLKEAFDNIENKRQFGQKVSHTIKGVTTQLNITAEQQSEGSTSQVSALTQVTAFLVELTSTAANITNRSNHINAAAQQVLDSVQQVKLTSQSVSQIGERGLDAVENTIHNNQQVNLWYDDLVGGLAELSQYSDQMKSVINLLQIISDETHLLALNAAIEAAGAGEYGSRFEVVAQEIRALSSRSLKASKDVAGLLLEVETGIRLAGQVVKNGKQATQVALAVAHQSGAVIHELAAVIRQNSQEVEKIQQAVNQMNELTREIGSATAQQHAASDQAVRALQEVNSISRQTADGSHEVKNTTVDLHRLSDELLQTLAV